MTRRFFDTVPYIGGDVQVARDLHATSTQRHNRLAVFGDSLETMPAGYGNDFVGWMNLLAKRRYGAPSESLVIGGQAETTRYGVQGLIQTDSAAPINYSLQSLPNLPIKSSSSNSTYTEHTVTQLLYRGNANVASLYDIEDYFSYDPANIRMEFFCATNPDGPVKIRWVYIPHTAGSFSLGQPIVQQSTAFGSENEVGTDGPADSFVKYRTSVIATTDRDYPQVIWAGGDASNAHAAGLNMAGMRWILNPDDPNGMGIQSFAKGGATINTTGFTPWRQDHGNAYEQFKIYGPWSALILGMGVNDAAREVSDELHKSQLLEWIEEFRGPLWDQWEIPIVLMTDPIVHNPAGFTADELDALKRQAQVHYEIANEYPGQRIMSVNMMRMMDDEGYDPSNQGADPNTNHTVDGIHYHPIWAKKRAELFFDLIDLAVAAASTSTTISGIRRAF